MAADPKYAILVNSCDSFSDCWEPFFRLFATYWPEWKGPIYLNTERAVFSCSDLDIISTRTWMDNGRRPTWSECLRRGLEMVPSEQILYFQEDYFLNAAVQQEMIDYCSERVLGPDVSHVRLTTFADNGPCHPTNDPIVRQLDRSADYLVSLQVALWQKESLLSQLRMHESAWQFEISGTRRARRRKERVLGLDKKLLIERKVCSYTPTGIVKGYWNRLAVQELFAAHGIEVDFSRRGFGDEAGPLKKGPLLRRVFDRLRSLV